AVSNGTSRRRAREAMKLAPPPLNQLRSAKKPASTKNSGLMNSSIDQNVALTRRLLLSSTAHTNPGIGCCRYGTQACRETTSSAAPARTRSGPSERLPTGCSGVSPAELIPASLFPTRPIVSRASLMLIASHSDGWQQAVLSLAAQRRPSPVALAQVGQPRTGVSGVGAVTKPAQQRGITSGRFAWPGQFFKSFAGLQQRCGGPLALGVQRIDAAVLVDRLSVFALQKICLSDQPLRPWTQF